MLLNFHCIVSVKLDFSIRETKIGIYLVPGPILALSRFPTNQGFTKS